MTFLLDTHLLLWASENSPMLPTRVSQLLTTGNHSPIFSAINIWEIAIKHGLHKPGFHAEPRRFRRRLLDNAYLELAMTSNHALMLDTLLPVHHDPFDRLLIAQAKSEGIVFLTADRILAQYGDPVQVL